LLTDDAIRGDRNVIKREVEILKYKDHITEIQGVWNVKAKVPVFPFITVIKGETGTISESFRKYLSKVPGKHDVQELNKTATLSTAHTLREVLLYSGEGLSWERALHVLYSVTAELLQQYIALGRGLFQLYDCKYLA